MVSLLGTVLCSVALGLPTSNDASSIASVSITAPTPGKTSCKGSPQGVALDGTFYFLPTPGNAPSITTYTPASKSWDTIPIPDSTPVPKMLEGASFAAVKAALPGIDDFLVVSGGRSKNVVAYNVQKKSWTSMKPLSNSISDNCAVGCYGYWLTMTGDMSKDDDTVPEAANTTARRVGKPANRQVYRYNLTSGEAYENNGEKQRGGAGCGCADDRAFWAGGFSDSGISSDVESWGVDPFHRRGEPSFGTSTKRRDVGAAACGGYFVVAGGTDGKHALASVDVFNASSSTGGKPSATYNLGDALTLPRVACLGDRYAVISGGIAGSTCNSKVYVLDTTSMPTNGAALPTTSSPLSSKGQVAVASDGSGTAMFFDGATGDVLNI